MCALPSRPCRQAYGYDSPSHIPKDADYLDPVDGVTPQRNYFAIDTAIYLRKSTSSARNTRATSPSSLTSRTPYINKYLTTWSRILPKNGNEDNMAWAARLLLVFGEVESLKLGWDTDYPDFFRASTQSCQENVAIFKVRPRPLPSTSFRNHYSLIIQPFNSMNTVMAIFTITIKTCLVTVTTEYITVKVFSCKLYLPCQFTTICQWDPKALCLYWAQKCLKPVLVQTPGLVNKLSY